MVRRDVQHVEVVAFPLYLRPLDRLKAHGVERVEYLTGDLRRRVQAAAHWAPVRGA